MRETTLARYDPVADVWQRSRAAWEPQFEADEQALLVGAWTGEQLIVAGVTRVRYEPDHRGIWSRPVHTLSAYLYDPHADAWTAGEQIDVSSSDGLAGVWSGSELLVFTGERVLAFTP